jgi:hypothetical protein
MNQPEAFAAITIAAVASDGQFASEEASLIRKQLLGRSPFRSMDPLEFGTMFSDLLHRLRGVGSRALVQEAAPRLDTAQRESAFALAAELVHCDRNVSDAERAFLEDLGQRLELPAERSRQILEVLELLNADCLS